MHSSPQRTQIRRVWLDEAAGRPLHSLQPMAAPADIRPGARVADRRAPRLLRALLGALCGVASGCATLPTLPSKGGPRWYRVETPNFTVYSDLPDDDAIESARELERMLVAYLRAGWETRGKWPPLHLQVVVFRDADNVEVFAPGHAGYFVSEVLFEPVAVSGPIGDLEELTTLKHELSHYIAYVAIPHQPTWFAEGIASFFQTARFEHGLFTLGRVPKMLHQVLQQHGITSARLLLAPRVAHPDAPFYASSWLLVHYLMTQRAAAFVAYQSALAAGESFDLAFQHAFGNWSPDEIDRALSSYFRRGVFENISMEVPTPTVVPRLTPMRESEVHALWAELFVSCPECGNDRASKSDEHAALALAEDPHGVVATMVAVLRNQNHDRRLLLANDAVQRHPDSWLAWLELGWLLQADLKLASRNPSDAPPLLTRAIERVRALAPDQPYGMMLAALQALREGRRDDALTSSAAALNRRPPTAMLLLLRAAVLANLHECDELERVVGRLEGTLHELLAPQQSAALLALGHACAQGAPLSEAVGSPSSTR